MERKETFSTIMVNLKVHPLSVLENKYTKMVMMNIVVIVLFLVWTCNAIAKTENGIKRTGNGMKRTWDGDWKRGCSIMIKGSLFGKKLGKFRYL
jgi:hypothetical protein